MRVTGGGYRSRLYKYTAGARSQSHDTTARSHALQPAVTRPSPPHALLQVFDWYCVDPSQPLDPSGGHMGVGLSELAALGLDQNATVVTVPELLG